MILKTFNIQLRPKLLDFEARITQSALADKYSYCYWDSITKVFRVYFNEALISTEELLLQDIVDATEIVECIY